MTSELQVIVVIGQVASGKTTVTREVARQLAGPVTGIEQLHATRSDAGPAGVARALAAVTDSGTVVYECSGAHPDFEETLFAIEARGAVPFVALLEVSVETATRRLQERGQREPPRGGGSWSEHLQWVQTRLRLVPVDVCVSTEHTDPLEAANQILRAFATRAQGQSVARGVFSFSRLATYEVCPLSHRFKYIEGREEEWVPPPVWLGKCLHLALARLYVPGASGMNLGSLLALFEAIVETETDVGTERQWGIAQGLEILEFHYRTAFACDTREALATEKGVALDLGSGVVLTGTIDRLVRTRAGIIEVIDYKTRLVASSSRPRIPDLLQLAGYGTAVLVEYDAQDVFLRRHYLASGEEDRLLLRLEDTASVRLALHRWIRRLSGGDAPRPGRHCRMCFFGPSCEHAAVEGARGTTGTRPAS